MLTTWRSIGYQGGWHKKALEDAEIDDVEAKDILYMNTLLRYNLFLDPDTLSDEEWAWTIRYLKEIKEAENKTDG